MKLKDLEQKVECLENGHKWELIGIGYPPGIFVVFGGASAACVRAKCSRCGKTKVAVISNKEAKAYKAIIERLG